MSALILDKLNWLLQLVSICTLKDLLSDPYVVIQGWMPGAGVGGDGG